MGLGGNITRYLLYVTIPLAAVLVFFHLECSIEKKWTFENKFNDEYNPAVTECSSALYFINGDLLTIKFGPEWFLVQWIPCSVSKLVGFISMRLGKTRLQFLSISHQNDYNYFRHSFRL